MSCDPKLFSGIDRKTLAAVRDKLTHSGFPMEGEQGTIKGPMGIEMSYRYDADKEQMEVQVLKKNFLIPCAKIYGEIEKALKDLRERTA